MEKSKLDRAPRNLEFVQEEIKIYGELASSYCCPSLADRHPTGGHIS